MTGWGRLSTGNYARSLNLTIRSNGVCTTQNLSKKIRYTVLRDLEIQSDHLNSTRRPDLVIVNKKRRTSSIVDFAVPAR